MSEMSDAILNTDMARSMLKMVSPIYDDSYVGLWVINIIAGEYQTLRDVVDTFPLQLSPETATWAIELWEQRYGVRTDESLTLQQRRDAVSGKRSIKDARNPERVRKALEKLSGVGVRIDEHSGDYTFTVYFQSDSRLSEDGLKAYIERIKPAHLSYEIKYEYFTRATQYHAGVVSYHTQVTITQASA